MDIVILHWMYPSNKIYQQRWKQRLEGIVENFRQYALYLECEHFQKPLPRSFKEYISKKPILAGSCPYCRQGRVKGYWDKIMVYFECTRCGFPVSTYFTEYP